MSAPRRTWIGYAAIVVSSAAYLDLIDTTVRGAVARTGSPFGDLMELIGWSTAFAAIDAVVLLWLLTATSCLFIRRALAHQTLLLTNLFLVPTILIPLIRHYHFYQKYIDSDPALLQRMSDSYASGAFQILLLLLSTLFLGIPSVRFGYYHAMPNRNSPRQVAAVAAGCIAVTTATIYVRAPW